MPKAELAQHLAKQTIWLMGISFILGSLFTIFILIILDMLNRNRAAITDQSESADH